MIIGLGSDIIDIRRIEQTLARFGERFTNRVFTDTERGRSERRANPAASYARRFAAKEACAKALGTGIDQSVFWRDMAVENLPTGQPTLQLSGGAQRRLEAITPAGMDACIHLSLSDDHPLAQATVVIEALPVADGMSHSRQT